MLYPHEYPDHCYGQIVAINRELENIEMLERLKEGPYADCADLLDELIANKNQRITALAERVASEVRESINSKKKWLLKPFEPHGLYDRADIAKHDGRIRDGYESLNVLYARSTEIYELALTDGVLLDNVLQALERHQTLIDETNQELSKEIDKVFR